MKTNLALLALTLVALAVPVARADLLDVNLTGEIRLGHRAPPAPPSVVVVGEAGPRGPSPWENGRWYQHSKGYYYYPADNVYYRPADHVWFYQDRGQWRSDRNLPASVNIDFDRSVALTMATDRPYTFHQQVIARYPTNYFGAHVRRQDDDRREQRSDDRRDDHRDDGKDRDNRK
jgi:hypothetical protein